MDKTSCNTSGAIQNVFENVSKITKYSTQAILFLQLSSSAVRDRAKRITFFTLSSIRLGNSNVQLCPLRVGFNLVNKL